MVRMDEFITKRLASQETGTLGPDLSVAKAIGAIGKAGASALASREVQASKLQGNLDTVNANKRTVDFDVEIDELRRSAKSVDEFNNKSREVFDRHLEGSTTDREKALFSTKGSAVIRTSNDDVFRRVQRQKKAEVESKVKTTVDNLGRIVAANFGDRSLALEDKINIFENKVTQGAVMIEELTGSVKSSVLKEFREDSAFNITMSAVRGLLESNPEQVEAFLQSEVIRGRPSVTQATEEEDRGILSKS